MKRICNLSTFSFLTIYLMIIIVTSCKTEDPNKPKLLPILTTTEITNITQNTANGGGTVISDNGLEVTARGVCWSLKPNPTINDSITKDSLGMGVFTSKISNLIADTTYYVRAYATNNDGTAYGFQVTLKTLVSVLPILATTEASNITESNALSGGNITFNGGSTIIACGVCWSKTPNPTIELSTKTSESFGTNTFTSLISNLSVNTTYFLRAYATTIAGTGYGNQITFNTLSIPTLNTEIVNNITTTNSISGGNITNDGGAAVIARGVCWSTDRNPTNTLSTKTNDGTGKGRFTSLITDLSLGTTYYVRAYATNSIGTAYGEEFNFSTGIGALYLGGKIAYLDASGKHGFVSALISVH